MYNVQVGSFQRDPQHWLFKFSPEEWIRVALREIRQAEEAFKAHNVRAGLAGSKRAAGMALNGALILVPNPAWGRSFTDHIQALSKDDTAPQAVRDACKVLLEAPVPSGSFVPLRTSRSDERVLEAARDVMAHAYALVKRNEPPVTG
jgi:HEPN domain-containing protein